MSVIKYKNGKWLAHVDKVGIPRVRRSFSTKNEAEQFERDYIVTHTAHAQTAAMDNRTITDLAALWFMYQGVSLSSGERRLKTLNRIATALNNPVARTLKAETFVDYRFKQLQRGLSAGTVNNHHAFLSALYEKLFKLKVIEYENPIRHVDSIKLHEKQLSYLSKEQIDALLDATIAESVVNKSTWYVVQLCLRTGARWGEVERLKFKQLHDCRVTYEYTKSKKTRTIPLDPIFFNKLIEFCLGKNPNDRIFDNCIMAFRGAVTRAGVELQAGQSSHILRHTFASYFVINGGNILSLQKILGHADIAMTMRYAHLSPDHFQDALRLNPIANIGCDNSQNSQNDSQ